MANLYDIDEHANGNERKQHRGGGNKKGRDCKEPFDISVQFQMPLGDVLKFGTRLGRNDVLKNISASRRSCEECGSQGVDRSGNRMCDGCYPACVDLGKPYCRGRTKRPRRSVIARMEL